MWEVILNIPLVPKCTKPIDACVRFCHIANQNFLLLFSTFIFSWQKKVFPKLKLLSIFFPTFEQEQYYIMQTKTRLKHKNSLRLMTSLSFEKLIARAKGKYNWMPHNGTIHNSIIPCLDVKWRVRRRPTRPNYT